MSMNDDRLIMIRPADTAVPDDVLHDMYGGRVIPEDSDMGEFLATRPTASKDDYAEAMKQLYEEYPDNREAKINLLWLMMIDFQFGIKYEPDKV